MDTSGNMRAVKVFDYHVHVCFVIHVLASDQFTDWILDAPDGFCLYRGILKKEKSSLYQTSYTRNVTDCKLLFLFNPP